MGNVEYYLKIDKRQLSRLRGDPAAMLWFAALSDYRRRFRPDKLCYIRISRKMIEDDFGLSRKQIQYLNLKLEAVKLIELDKLQRGGRIPAGYKFL